jgi:hypothetical protein
MAVLITKTAIARGKPLVRIPTRIKGKIFCLARLLRFAFWCDERFDFVSHSHVYFAAG